MRDPSLDMKISTLLHLVLLSTQPDPVQSSKGYDSRTEVIFCPVEISG